MVKNYTVFEGSKLQLSPVCGVCPQGCPVSAPASMRLHERYAAAHHIIRSVAMSSLQRPILLAQIERLHTDTVRME